MNEDAIQAVADDMIAEIDEAAGPDVMTPEEASEFYGIIEDHCRLMRAEMRE